MKEHYPISNVDDLLDNLRGKVLFIKLDLKNAYFHVWVSKQSSKYLSFSIFLGQYKYVWLPLGSCNSLIVIDSRVFELLKIKLVQMIIPALYFPSAETEQHCDGIALGYGIILLEKQKDRLMHLVFYHSNRTTEIEVIYHS